jgi:rhodanese-related sulfurtransferase
MGFWKRGIGEALILLVISSAVALIYNKFNPKGIAIASRYPRLKSEREVGEPARIDLEEAYRLFVEGAVFLDARDPEEFYVGHIYGAKNLPYEKMEEFDTLLEHLPKDTTIVTYCDGEGCELSIHLAVELMKRGFTKVYAFYAGWREWMESDYPVDVGE